MGVGRSFEGRGGLVLIKSERDWRGGGGGGRTGGQFVRVSYKSFKGIYLTVLGKKYMYIHIYFDNLSPYAYTSILYLVPCRKL